MSVPDDHAERARAYWRANRRLILLLLVIWAGVSYGCSILFVEQLNAFTIGKIPLGFWFSQQGSIYVFVLLVLVYAVAMDYFDKRYGMGEIRKGADENKTSAPSGGGDAEKGGGPDA
jgi:putative solute:sodium symporter small subunit